MILGLDHVVIAVPDLDVATESYQRLGFTVIPGGEHRENGTHNALIRLGSTYLELISVRRPELATQSSRGAELVRFLATSGGGNLGFALTSDDLDGDARALEQASGIGVPVIPMSRHRPDGSVVSWRLAIPDEVAWRRPWPFLIQWDEPLERRLAAMPSAHHPNGAHSISELVVRIGSAFHLAMYGALSLGPLRETESPSGAPAYVIALGALRLVLAEEARAEDLGLHSVTVAARPTTERSVQPAVSLDRTLAIGARISLVREDHLPARHS